MSAEQQSSYTPKDKRALVAVDLGAESCRVSLLRWHGDTPEIILVHRFANSPRENEGLRWPLDAIEAGVDEGLRRCATLASEGVRSIAVDGWAVDYVRLDNNGQPLTEPFCYRDERTLAIEEDLHKTISIDRLHEITGVRASRINTLYQLYADASAGNPSQRWLNLPEYMLMRWGAEPVSEYTNATHTQMIDLQTRTWNDEIQMVAEVEYRHMPRLVESGTRLGRLSGPLAALPAFHNTVLLVPACHDTASAIAGISATGNEWAYISSGTWSLIGTVLPSPCNTPEALRDGFTNLGAIGGRICFHKGVSGMWLLKQCMETWAASRVWELEDLIAAVQQLPAPEVLLDVDDPELLLAGDMPKRINSQRQQRGLPLFDESSAAAPQMAALIFHSLAAKYAEVLEQLEHHTGRRFSQIIIVGGGSLNDFLCQLTEQRTGRPVIRGSAESSTIGNFAVQLAALESNLFGNDARFAAEVSAWSTLLQKTAGALQGTHSQDGKQCTDATC